MNKVITVNLNGNAYQVEERGYIALNEYLEDAEARLKDNPDLLEIMADLEQAIADKCNRYLTPGKNVIAGSEIDQILNEMGRVESDAGEGAEGQSKDTRKEQARADSGTHKRLYRLREGAMVGGVCMGLAAYLNMDVTLVRLAFGILAVASAGFFILVYFAAMIIIPPADTSEERAKAYGMPFNAQELVDQAKQHYANFKKGSEKWWGKAGPGSPDWSAFGRNMKDMGRETRRAAWQARRAARRARWAFHTPAEVDYGSHVLSMVMLPIFGLVIAVLTLIWILAVISLVYTGAVFGWPLPVAIPLWASVLILIVLYGAVIGPFKMAFHGRGYVHAGRYYSWPGVLGGTVWLGCMMLAVVFAYTYIPEVREFVENLPSMVDRLVRR